MRAGEGCAEDAFLIKLPRPTENRAWCVWAGYFGVLCLLLFLQPGKGSVTHEYFPTARAWWGGTRDLYTSGIAGYLYLPQSVFLFSPFAWLPAPLDDALWRLFALVLLATGLRRVSFLAAPERGREVFAWATLLVLLAGYGAARNGQTNAHLAGVMLHVCVELTERRWWRATLLLWVGMMMKPIALVMILLSAVLFRPMGWRLAIGLLLFAALPYLHPDTAYVTRQYQLGFEKILRSSQPGEKPYADLVGLLRTIGVNLPQMARTVMQLIAAALTLWVCRLGLKRGGRLQGTWLLGAWAAWYLVLFNPRTETNSYVLLAPFVAVAVLLTWMGGARKAEWLGLLVLGLALGCDNYGRSFHNLTTIWLKPLTALVFGGWLLWRLRSLPMRPLFLRD